MTRNGPASGGRAVEYRPLSSLEQLRHLYGRHIAGEKRDLHDRVLATGRHPRRACAHLRRASGQDTRLQHMERLERLAGLAHAGAPPVVADYRDALTRHAAPGAVVYLDPPYADTNPYPGAPMFDTPAMWAHAARAVDAGAHVYVSEYAAPAGWRPILTFTRQNTLASDARAKATSRATERLYAPDRP